MSPMNLGKERYFMENFGSESIKEENQPSTGASSHNDDLCDACACILSSSRRNSSSSCSYLKFRIFQRIPIIITKILEQSIKKFTPLQQALHSSIALLLLDKQKFFF